VPATVAVLTTNLNLNQIKNAIIVDKCAWNKRERITLKIPQGYYGLSSAFYNRNTTCTTIEVKYVRLSDILKKYERINL